MLRLFREVHEYEEAQGDMEVWWGEEQEGKRTGVQIGSETAKRLREEDEGVAVSFQMTGTGQPAEEVGHTCWESAGGSG